MIRDSLTRLSAREESRTSTVLCYVMAEDEESGYKCLQFKVNKSTSKANVSPICHIASNVGSRIKDEDLDKGTLVSFTASIKVKLCKSFSLLLLFKLF